MKQTMSLFEFRCTSAFTRLYHNIARVQLGQISRKCCFRASPKFWRKKLVTLASDVYRRFEILVIDRLLKRFVCSFQYRNVHAKSEVNHMLGLVNPLRLYDEYDILLRLLPGATLE